MIGRKSIIGIASLVALALCAVAASSAFAGGRAFECAPGSGEFSDAHCVTKTAGSFKHVAIANGTAVPIIGTNAKTASGTTAAAVAKLKGKIAGIPTEVQCTGVSGSGSLTNAATGVSGTGKIKYSGCTVTLPVRECIVHEEGLEVGVIETFELAATTVGLGANELKFSPASGTEFARIPIEKCKENLPPAGTYLVTGSLIGTTSGATTTTTHAGVTAQGNLFFGGNVAGLEGSITISRTSNSNPISLT